MTAPSVSGSENAAKVGVYGNAFKFKSYALFRHFDIQGRHIRKWVADHTADDIVSAQGSHLRIAVKAVQQSSNSLLGIIKTISYSIYGINEQLLRIAAYCSGIVIYCS